MKTANIYAIMVEEESGGFTTGIGTETKNYTHNEVIEKKYLELTENIELIDGCVWSFSIKWI